MYIYYVYAFERIYIYIYTYIYMCIYVCVYVNICVYDMTLFKRSAE